MIIAAMNDVVELTVSMAAGPALVRELERRRIAIGLSRVSLCKSANIAPITMRRWLEGESSPTLIALQRVAAVIAAAERSQ